MRDATSVYFTKAEAEAFEAKITVPSDSRFVRGIVPGAGYYRMCGNPYFRFRVGFDEYVENLRELGYRLNGEMEVAYIPMAAPAVALAGLALPTPVRRALEAMWPRVVAEVAE